MYVANSLLTHLKGLMQLAGEEWENTSRNYLVCTSPYLPYIVHLRVTIIRAIILIWNIYCRQKKVEL